MVPNPGGILDAASTTQITTFSSPQGKVILRVDRFADLPQLYIPASNFTVNIHHMSEAHLVAAYQAPEETDAVIQGPYPGCQFETVIVGIRFRHVTGDRLRYCAPFRFSFDGRGVTAVQQGAMDPEVYRFVDGRLEGPVLLSHLTGRTRAKILAQSPSLQSQATALSAPVYRPPGASIPMARADIPGTAPQADGALPAKPSLDLRPD